MEFIYAVIFGIVQGITEFLPISSSGHLVILHNFITLPIKNELVFDIVLHSATLLAVLWFFKQEVWQLLKSWFKSFYGQKDPYSKISWLIILGTIPAALTGWFFDEIIESVLRSPIVVVIMLIVVGFLFIILEKYSRQKNELENLNWFKVLIIGVLQAVALIPGTSRSGITIIAGLGVGLKREVAVRFSFLLSIPIIAGAVIKKVPLIFRTDLIGSEWVILFLAFMAALISGFLSIKYFLQFAKRRSLNIFAIYRFLLAILIIIFLLKGF